MKKQFFSLLMFVSFVGFAQEEKEAITHKSELSLNVFDLVVAGTVHVGYERFLENNQSISIDGYLKDSYGYFDTAYQDKNTVYSIRGAYNIYFSNSKQHHGFHFYPFLKLRTGKQSSDYSYTYYDENGNISTMISKDEEDLSGITAGFGVGHKWLFNNKITLGINGELGRELSNSFNTDYYSTVEPRFVIKFGFRF